MSTPLMQQYGEIKARHSDAILFFRLGDFYEMFADDALWVSKALSLTLTHRQGVPMCGVPHHAAENYMSRLLELGKKIALCEQLSLEAKGLAKRDVVEVLTPGSLVNQNFIKSPDSNYLACLSPIKEGFSFAYIDISTAEFVALTTFLKLEEWFFNQLDKLKIKELVIDENLLTEQLQKQLEGYPLFVNRYPSWLFDRKSAYQKLCGQLGVLNLKAFGFEEDDPSLGSAGALFNYLNDSTKKVLPHIKSLKKGNLLAGLLVDEQSRKNLELVENSSDRTSKFTLFHTLNATLSPMGNRLLKHQLLNPLNNKEEIESRLNRVELFFNDRPYLDQVRQVLAKIQDIERLSSKLAMDKAHGKDVLALKNSVKQGLELAEILGDKFNQTNLQPLQNWVTLIEEQLADNPSTVLNEGNLIKPKSNEELARLYQLKEKGNDLLTNYAEEQKLATGVNLRLKENRLIGAFLEVSKANADRLPDHYIRRQSVNNAERYSTPELNKLYNEITTAKEKAVELEKELFLSLCNQIKSQLPLLLATAQHIAVWDVATSLAFIALRHNYCRPTIKEEKGIFIKEGRHPVVERATEAHNFVSNSFKADSETEFLLITGPNMAGKSTYLRQNALMVLMAQMGSFVSAEQAEIGLVDKIFCRVGSGDNLAKGESTFLVEMNETARILRNATPSSLVIMDEVGRGTGSDDGLAIAHAIIDFLLSDIKALTLFATHYHELTQIKHPQFKNYCLKVAEEGGKIYFLKQIEEGAAKGSYGIDVALLAGIPTTVVEQARHYLNQLLQEKGRVSASPIPLKNYKEVELFVKEDLIVSALKDFNLEKSTPLEALNFVAKLKAMSDSF